MGNIYEKEMLYQLALEGNKDSEELLMKIYPQEYEKMINEKKRIEAENKKKQIDAEKENLKKVEEENYIKIQKRKEKINSLLNSENPELDQVGRAEFIYEEEKCYRRKGVSVEGHYMAGFWPVLNGRRISWEEAHKFEIEKMHIEKYMTKREYELRTLLIDRKGTGFRHDGYGGYGGIGSRRCVESKFEMLEKEIPLEGKIEAIKNSDDSYLEHSGVIYYMGERLKMTRRQYNLISEAGNEFEDYVTEFKELNNLTSEQEMVQRNSKAEPKMTQSNITFEKIKNIVEKLFGKDR